MSLFNIDGSIETTRISDHKGVPLGFPSFCRHFGKYRLTTGKPRLTGGKPRLTAGKYRLTGGKPILTEISAKL